jgi:hypothetical protein
VRLDDPLQQSPILGPAAAGRQLSTGSARAPELPNSLDSLNSSALPLR